MRFVRIENLPSVLRSRYGSNHVWAFWPSAGGLYLSTSPTFYMYDDNDREVVTQLEEDEPYNTVQYSDIVREEANEQEDAGFFGRFTLRGWCSPSTLSSVQRYRARTSRNSDGTRSAVAMPQGELSEPRESAIGPTSSSFWANLDSSTIDLIDSHFVSQFSTEAVPVQDSVGSDTTEARGSVAQAQESDAERSRRIREQLERARPTRSRFAP